MTPDAAVTVELDGPIDLVPSLKRLQLWAGGPTARREGDSYRRAVLTPEGPGTVLYAPQRSDAVAVRAWGPGAGWLTAAAPRWLGAHDRPSDWHPEHPELARLARAARGMRFGATGLVLDRLVPAILGQLVTSKGADRSWSQLAWRYGEPAPGPGELVLPPDPEVLSRLGAFRFVPCGVEAKRAVTVIEACRRRKRLEEAAAMSTADAERRLTALRGIGAWTAAMTITVTHGDPDVIPVGDHNLPHLVSFALAGEPRGSDDRMLELLEPHRPHRMRLVLALKRAGIAAPRYGPRVPIRDIRG